MSDNLSYCYKYRFCRIIRHKNKIVTGSCADANYAFSVNVKMDDIKLWLLFGYGKTQKPISSRFVRNELFRFAETEILPSASIDVGDECRFRV